MRSPIIFSIQDKVTLLRFSQKLTWFNSAEIMFVGDLLFREAKRIVERFQNIDLWREASLRSTSFRESKVVIL
jgi:hypothetical protein